MAAGQGTVQIIKQLDQPDLILAGEGDLSEPLKKALAPFLTSPTNQSNLLLGRVMGFFHSRGQQTADREQGGFVENQIFSKPSKL